MRQKIKILLNVILLTIIVHELSYAECDNLPSIKCNELRYVKSDSTCYQKRSENRCEGFYESNVSSGSLNIVSVTYGKFKYKLDPDEILTVSPIVNDKAVKIRAVGIPIKTYYMMDAEVSPNTSLKWPVGDVLYPQKLKDKKVGVFGWIRNQNDKILVPLKITSKMLPAYNKSQDIYVYLRASMDIMNVSWRISNLSSNNFCSSTGKWIKSEKYKYYEGTRILCKIPADIIGPICIEVRAYPCDSDEPLSCEAKIFSKRNN